VKNKRRNPKGKDGEKQKRRISRNSSDTFFVGEAKAGPGRRIGR